MKWPQAEAWGFFIITALRAEEYASAEVALFYEAVAESLEEIA